jgi:hypothetical protein
MCISWCKNFDNIKMHGTTVKFTYSVYLLYRSGIFVA